MISVVVLFLMTVCWSTNIHTWIRQWCKQVTRFLLQVFWYQNLESVEWCAVYWQELLLVADGLASLWQWTNLAPGQATSRECWGACNNLECAVHLWAVSVMFDSENETIFCHHFGLTLIRLGNFFHYVILFPDVVQQKCNIFIWNRPNKLNVQSVLRILMACCFSTRASVATVLATHPCVSRCLRVKYSQDLFNWIFLILHRWIMCSLCSS